MRDASLIPSALLDARELAAMLSISVPTVWRWRANGKLPPAIALSSQCVRWRRSTVLSWLESLDATNEQRPAVHSGEASEIRQSPLGSEVTA